MGVASVRFGVNATAFAAVHRRNDHVAGPVMTASTAGAGALGVVRPPRHDAVYWACFLIADEDVSNYLRQEEEDYNAFLSRNDGAQPSVLPPGKR